MRVFGRDNMRVTDLFAGAGGFTEGLRQASEKFKPVQAVEWDRDAASTYAHNFTDTSVHCENILDWLDHRSFVDTDVVIGGPPCQGFSTLGKREVDDAKNLLWQQYAEFISVMKPKYFVMENVPPFNSSPQKAIFLAELREGKLSDYTASFHIVNTAEYGAPQTRRRVFVLGSHRDLPTLVMPKPTHGAQDFRTVRDALEGIDPAVNSTDLPDRRIEAWGVSRPGAFATNELHLGRKYSELSLKRFRKIPPGGNRFDLPFELQAPCWQKHMSGSGDVMGRLHLDKPSVTIRTEFNKPEKGRYLHPSEDRAITHFEAARLMGFRDDYWWVGSKTSIAKQIGNAVPIAIGEALGKALLELAC